MSDRHQQKPYPLRMPPDLRQRLEDAAKQAGRSLHAEIIRRLEIPFSLSESGATVRSEALGGAAASELAAIYDAAAAQQDERMHQGLRSLITEMSDIAYLTTRREGLHADLDACTDELRQIEVYGAALDRELKELPTDPNQHDAATLLHKLQLEQDIRTLASRHRLATLRKKSLIKEFNALEGRLEVAQRLHEKAAALTTAKPSAGQE